MTSFFCNQVGPFFIADRVPFCLPFTCLSQEIERKGEDITLGQIESDFFKVPWVSDLTFY